MLKQRVLTAVILAVGAILALFGASPIVWLSIMLVIGFIAAWEWTGFAGLNSSLQKTIYASTTVGLSYLGLEYLSHQNLVVFTLLEMVLLIRIVGRYQRSKGQTVVSSVGLVLALGWLFIPLFVIVMIQFRELFSAEALLMSLFTIWAIDTGAYFSGRKFGKNKLAKYVSPGKTWEGVYGGVILAFIVALIGVYLIEPELVFSLEIFALIAAFIAMFSVLGDLFESVLKRQVGLKDSGSILPGHGGVLDRIDSLLIAVPMFYVLWAYGSSLL
ncbi:MAG: phosphatidate cytidylyltransferase [Pseudomonadota bacterium]|nr:phosphatidate cytidylyltransferase [Pseudomonadota bacterium]